MQAEDKSYSSQLVKPGFEPRANSRTLSPFVVHLIQSIQRLKFVRWKIIPASLKLPHTLLNKNCTHPIIIILFHVYFKKQVGLQLVLLILVCEI